MAIITDGFGVEVTHVRTSDVDAIVKGAERLYGGISRLLREDLAWEAEIAKLGPVTLVQGRVDKPVAARYTLSRYAFVMARSSPVEAHTGSQTLRANPGATALSMSPGVSADMKFPAGMRNLNLVLEPSFVKAQLEALLGGPVHEDVTFESTLGLDVGAGAFLQRSCEYLAGELGRTDGRLPPLLAASVCESLVRAVLSGHAHSHSSLLERPPPPSSRTIVRRVEEYLDANAGAPIVGSHLARVAGESVVAVEVAFQKHRGTLPAAFLRRRRLERAREALLLDASLSTARAGQLAGYLGVEAFEAAYYKAFNETPAQTRQRGASCGRPSVAPPPREDPAARISLRSPREHAVGDRVAKGLLNKQIAAALGISEKMVQKHRAHAMQKLGIASATELARLWERNSR